MNVSYCCYHHRHHHYYDDDYYHYYYFLLSECREDPPSYTSASFVVPVTREIGRSVSYMCDSGLSPSGNAFSTCLMNGHWSPADFSCVGKIRAKTELEGKY